MHAFQNLTTTQLQQQIICTVQHFSLQALVRVQEEGAKDGVQRHIWWRTTLPHAPGVTAYISPVFDVIWIASDPKHILKPEKAQNESARYNFTHCLDGAHSAHHCFFHLHAIVAAADP